MSVLAEFTLSSEEFHFGEVLSRNFPRHVELKQVVPIQKGAAPYFWSEDDDSVRFEETLRGYQCIKSLKRIDQIGDHVLYRIQSSEETNIFTGILESDGILLQASGDTTWKLQTLFSDRKELGKFFGFCVDNEIDIQVKRVVPLSDTGENGGGFGLTSKQRKALAVAADQGYFKSPSAVTLDEIGDELGISSQACSKRIRSGVEKLVTNALETTK